MKTVLITGAGRGIGLALTQQFLQKDHHVLATYRDEVSAADLLALAQTSKNLQLIKMDVAQESTWGDFKAVVTKSPPDILINNAGVIGSQSASIRDVNLKQLAEVFSVNTFAPLTVSQFVAPLMKAGSTVAHITSLMGSMADNKGGGYYDYRMSKAALNMMNKCLSIEFSKLTCLVLHPGWVQTDMGGSAAPVQPEASAKGLTEVILKSQIAQSGHFYDFRGQELPW
ncbi:MAG: SDR family oxidoreductase [Bdellovibrionaceae bacterium]|nr:SDR family oxidoreductase [Pseudobdellovibrionaceae bacterium]